MGTKLASLSSDSPLSSDLGATQVERQVAALRNEVAVLEGTVERLASVLTGLTRPVLVAVQARALPQDSGPPMPPVCCTLVDTSMVINDIQTRINELIERLD